MANAVLGGGKNYGQGGQRVAAEQGPGMRWLMRLFQLSQPPERTSTDVARDPAYQEDKEAAQQKQLELVARLKRLGYDFDVSTRRDRNDPAHR